MFFFLILFQDSKIILRHSRHLCNQNNFAFSYHKLRRNTRIKRFIRHWEFLAQMSKAWCYKIQLWWPSLWSRGNIVASHLAVRSPVGSVFWLRFLPEFILSCRQMLEKLRLHLSPGITGHHSHQKSFITGASDLWCLHALKLHIYPTLVVQIFPFPQKVSYKINKYLYECWCRN